MKLDLGTRTLVLACGLVAIGSLVVPAVACAQAPPATPDSTSAAPADSVAPATPATPAPPAVTATVAPTSSSPLQVAGMFSKGNRRVTATAGWGHSFDNDYLLLGLGVGYFIANGLDVGVDFEGWVIGDPTIYKVSPRADYVLWKAKRIKPYAGAFYRWNFIGSGIDDKNSLGGRAGAFYQNKGRGMLGAGVVYERYLDLDDRIGSSDVLYPEIFFAVSF